MILGVNCHGICVRVGVWYDFLKSNKRPKSLILNINKGVCLLKLGLMAIFDDFYFYFFARYQISIVVALFGTRSIFLMIMDPFSSSTPHF